MNTFRVRGVDPAPFQHLYGLKDGELQSRGVQRVIAEPGSTLPDRIELRHALPGENVLLLNYEHQPAATPYRANHAIYAIEGATQAAEFLDVIPEPLLVRLLSLRVFDAQHMMIDATVVEGKSAEAAVRELLTNPRAAYIHAHYAARGCYAALVTRA